MGERTYIYLVNDEIYLYSHWNDREFMKEIVKQALIRGKGRWNDRQYLNRIIFSELIKDDILGLTDFGLSSEIFDGEIVVNVDVDKMKVGKKSFDDFIK